MTSLHHRCVLLARATALATGFAIAAPAFAQSAPDLAKVYSMVKQMEARVAALEAENRQVKKDAAEARAEARALRQKLAAAPTEGSPSRSPASVQALGPSVQSAVAGMPAKAAPMPVYDRWRFYGGADLVYVQPRWSTNPAYQTQVALQNPTGSVQVVSNTQTDFDHAFRPTVALTAGVVAPGGLGLRGRYWWLDSDGAPIVLNNPFSSSVTSFRGFATAFPLGLGITTPGFLGAGNTANETYAISSGLHLKTADLEATWEMISGPWNLVAAGGVRYASLQQSYNVAHTQIQPGANPFGFTNQFDTLSASHDFSGFGPTVAAEARYALGWGGLSVYGNSCASWIFGTRSEQATIQTVSISPFFGPFTGTATSRTSTKTSLPMLEGEIGLQWQHTVAGVEALVRAGAYAQAWFNAGNAANSDTLSTTFCDECASPNANLSLIGFRLTGVIKF